MHKNEHVWKEISETKLIYHREKIYMQKTII